MQTVSQSVSQSVTLITSISSCDAKNADKYSKHWFWKYHWAELSQFMSFASWQQRWWGDSKRAARMSWKHGLVWRTGSNDIQPPSGLAFIHQQLLKLWKARNDPTHLLSQWWHTFLNQTADLCVCMSGRFFRHIGVRDHIWAKLPKSGKYRKSKVWDKKLWRFGDAPSWTLGAEGPFWSKTVTEKYGAPYDRLYVLEVNQEPHVASCVKISRVTL